MVIEIQWSLIAFSLFAGLGGCLFAFVGLATLLKGGTRARFVSTIIAIVLLLVGGIASVMHLANPQNVMAAATNIFSFSGISIELILLGVCLILMIVYLVVARSGDDGIVVKVVAVLGIVSGILLGFFVGHGYVLVARPAWDTEVMPLAYLASSLAAGGLLFVAVESVTKVDFEEIRAMRLPVVIVAALSAVCLIGYVAVIGFDKVQEANALLLWGGIVVCGVVLTLACGVLLYLAKEKTVVALSFVGLAAAFIGSLSVRVLMWSMTSGFLNFFENAAGFYPLQGF